MNKKKLDKLIAGLASIRKSARKLEKKYAEEVAQVHPAFQKSAVNLVHYLALRRHETADLEDDLERLGMSRLAKSESHVMASVVAVENRLREIRDVKLVPGAKRAVSIKKGRKLLTANTTALLGKKLKGSKVRIMVTLPTEAAHDRKLVLALVAGGMNAARINCAHDDPVTWLRMIDNVRAARRKTGRNCRICMDLGGPKLRTGPMMQGPRVVHLHPKRDALGNVIAPAQAWLGSEHSRPLPAGAVAIPVSGDVLDRASVGDTLGFIDARGKKRQLLLGAKLDHGRFASCYESAYLMAGTALEMDQGRTVITVGQLPPLEEAITLKKGDTLVLHRDPAPGESAVLDQLGSIVKTAHISCTLPEVFRNVQIGEPILFDDGKIEGVIRDASEDQLEVDITYAKGGVAKLRADKGINLPESRLELGALTEKDIEDLRFAAQHADAVDLSFVNGPEDVLELYKELDQLKRDDLGVILKIETQRGFRNLPAILLAAMRRFPVGVMIARGDLAVEGGWKHLAQLQEELLWMCEAGHIPIVWATQVLESLAKKGLPSRAEITDAAMAQRAECVMLNKGPHILETIAMLDAIMRSMDSYRRKQAPMLPMLETGEFMPII